MSPLMATVLVFLMSGFKSYSSTPTVQANVIDIIHQSQPLKAEMSPTVGKRQSRAPDIATTEDSYIEALRHSQNSRRKSSALPVDHAHHHGAHEGSSHGIVHSTQHQFNNDFSFAYATYESTSRPLTAMEINYLNPKKRSSTDVAADIANVEPSDDEEELADEEQVEDEDESEARQFVRLIRRPYYSVASANSIYSIHLANGAKLANRKDDDITQNTRILSQSKPISVGLSEAMEFITHRADGAFKKATMGKTASLSSTLIVNNRANRWLPAASAVGRRKKRSVLLNSDEKKNNKHDVKKRSSANDASKMSSINNLPVQFRFQKLSPTSTRAITSAHSSGKRSASSKLKNSKTTPFKQILPWFYSKFSKNQKRTANQEAADMKQGEKSNSGDDNPTTLTSNKPPNTAKLSFHDTLSNKEGHTPTNNSKFTHGHGIIVPSEHVSTSSNVNKDNTVIHGTSNDLSTYTHGHGIVIPNAPVYDKPLESSLVSDVVDNQNILSLLVNGTTSSNVVEGHDNVETTENISLLDPLIASLDGPVLTTGVFSDETDLALDDLESLMTDIIIAPLQVQAVVAEDGSSSDAVIIDAAEGNQPDTVPVVSNLANIFIAPSGSSGSSSSSLSSGSINSAGIIGDSSAVSVDPFALLNTIGLAAIGIFVLTLPIWVPFVVAQMKKRRNSFSRRSPFVFPIGSFNNDAEFHPYSTLLQKLTPPDAALNNPGPLSSEEVYGPASASYFGRKAARRRRSEQE